MILTAVISGDGECFCFKVDTKTYIQFFGQEKYDEEVKFQKESCKEIDMEYIERTEWCIDPGQFLNNERNSKTVTIDIDEGKQYFVQDDGRIGLKPYKKVTITV